MRCEGITKNVVERSIRLANYEKCLFTKTADEKMHVIRSHEHQV